MMNKTIGPNISDIRQNNLYQQKMKEIEDLSRQLSTLLEVFNASLFNYFDEEYCLTKRESEIVKLLVVTGLRDEELSSHLNVSVKTIKNHLTSIRSKTMTRSCRELQALVYRFTYSFITKHRGSGIEQILL